MFWISIFFFISFSPLFGINSGFDEGATLDGGHARLVHLNVQPDTNPAEYKVVKVPGSTQGLCITFTPPLSWRPTSLTREGLINFIKRGALGVPETKFCFLDHPLDLVYQKPPASVAKDFKTEVFKALETSGLRCLMADWQALEACAGGSGLPLGDFSGTLKGLTSLTLRNIYNVPSSWWGLLREKAPKLKEIELHSGSVSYEAFQALAEAFPTLERLSLLGVGVVWVRPEFWNKKLCIPAGLKHLSLRQCFEQIYYVDKFQGQEEVFLSKIQESLLFSKFLGARTLWKSLNSVSFSMLHTSLQGFCNDSAVRRDFQSVFLRAPNLSSFEVILPTFDFDYEQPMGCFDPFLPEYVSAGKHFCPLLGVSKMRWDKKNQGNRLTLDLAEALPFTDKQKFEVEGVESRTVYALRPVSEGGFRGPVLGKRKSLSRDEMEAFYNTFSSFIGLFPSVKQVRLNGNNTSSFEMATYFGGHKVECVVSKGPPVLPSVEMVEDVKDRLFNTLRELKVDVNERSFYCSALGFAFFELYHLLGIQERHAFLKQVPNDYCHSPLYTYLWEPLPGEKGWVSKSHRPMLPLQVLPTGVAEIKAWLEQDAVKPLVDAVHPLFCGKLLKEDYPSFLKTHLFSPISSIVPLPFFVERAEQIARTLFLEVFVRKKAGPPLSRTRSLPF